MESQTSENLQQDAQIPMLHVNAVARRFPGPDGRPRSTTTIVRWILSGVRRRGRTVRLAGQQVGAAWYTDEQSIARFIRELNSDGGVVSPDSGESDPERSRDTVDAALKADGL